MRKSILFYFIIFSFQIATAQNDTSKNPAKTLDEIVVTSTRTETKLSNVAVPTLLIPKSYILQTGSLKFQDVLQELTGVVIVNSSLATSLNGYPNPFGQGVQMLGLDPSYTAILMDGEPLVGRNAGILKLGRIATGNIKQIEIVKGPSSSLYGSEAMAGVINIITDPPKSENANLQLHTSTNNTYAQTISYSNHLNKTGIQIYMNRYATQGFDLDQNTYGKTIDPYRDWTMHFKITQAISSKSQLLISYRNFDSKQTNDYQIYWQSQPAIVKGYTKEKDNSLFSQLTYKVSPKNKLFFRTYYDSYSNISLVNLEGTNVKFDETSFNQSILKPEIQFQSTTSKRNYIAGIGSYFETIDASRYAGKQNLFSSYVFTQNEWYYLQKKLTFIAGARLDKRTDYAINLSPRIAAAFKPNSTWKFTASAGYGFKAPDFRHMYLNFYNAQIGYSLIGANVLSDELQHLQQQGELESGSNITPYSTTNLLNPEKSFGTHFGINYNSDKIHIEAGIFRNDIDNLIDVYLLPIKKTNDRSIYSYHNINRIFTQGFNIDIKYFILKNLSLALGYQYLEAKDKDVLDQINAGKIYKLDPNTYVTTLVSKSDYYGLSNRSRHTFNGKISWESDNKDWDIFFRLLYRGKYGYSDVNGNNIIDDDREMIQGYWMANLTASKKIIYNLNVQIGVDNLFNYTNVLQMPNIAGRLFFININYSLNHLFNKN